MSTRVPNDEAKSRMAATSTVAFGEFVGFQALGFVLLKRVAAVDLVVAGDDDVVEVEVDRDAGVEFGHGSSLRNRV